MTLVGPGGIGKTRLAVEVAHCIQAHFADGVFFVSLAPLRSVDTVPAAIIEALGLQHGRERQARQQLLNFLREKEILIVLDNFEHVRAASHIVDEIIQYTARTKVLVTSREALTLVGGQEYAVEGFGVPDVQVVDRFEAYDAVQLFANSALQVIQEFSPIAERDAIVQICSLVQGMPLALEMAASWLRVVPCKDLPDILRSLDNFVSRDNSNIRAVFERSWIFAY